jgi:hypothetical protein
MSQPPIPLHEIEASILTAIREFDWERGRPILAELVGNTPAYMAKHFALEHTIPSPSSVTDCRRQLWFKTHDTEVDRTLPGSWAMRAATGMVLEPWWFMILGLSDPRLAVTTQEEPLDIAPGVIGSPDGYLNEIGALVELKSQTGWKFIFNNEKGIDGESPEHVAQAQLYMHGAGREWCLYLASAADPAFVEWYKRPYIGPKGAKYKDPDFKYPFFLLHWIEYDPKEAKSLLTRMEQIRRDKRKDEPAPRDYNPETTKWPCQLGCRWRTQCEEIG